MKRVRSNVVLGAEVDMAKFMNAELEAIRDSLECGHCGAVFQQSTPAGRALYCSTKCRDTHYAAEKRAKAKQRVRQEDGTFKWVAPNAK